MTEDNVTIDAHKNSISLYIIGAFMTYYIIDDVITLKEFYAIFQSISDTVEMFLTHFLFATIIMIIAVIAFFRRKRYFPYLLIVILVYDICNPLNAMITNTFIEFFINNNIPLNTIYIVLNVLMLIYVIFSKNIKSVFVK
ncbi:hypothetical protein N5853_12870 [Bartonella sp. HY329]|uniref:hypothetical protein n=1 Tax=unclassified Bartonella TaxID=2645622 RepID=UPI0021CAA347|nr:MULTISPECIES: hypothetical protein [unclassified Bartonella]UXM94962.1 hypothetical protein N5853_12870 [Bartonella sp. HY329]UXN09285.1 hypothetical protein N5852_12880 [Bartonella sp. HY328]